MATHDLLLARIRGEYREMPGLRLTFEQARRLWHLDEVHCRAVLEHLVAEGFIHQAADGAYTALPETRSTPATSHPLQFAPTLEGEPVPERLSANRHGTPGRADARLSLDGS